MLTSPVDYQVLASLLITNLHEVVLVWQDSAVHVPEIFGVFAQATRESMFAARRPKSQRTAFTNYTAARFIEGACFRGIGMARLKRLCARRLCRWFGIDVLTARYAGVEHC